MARFDIYAHPEAAQRKATPYLMDVQNNYIDSVASRVVIPLRPAASFGPLMRDLNPVVTVAGKAMVADTTALAAFPAAGLKKPVSAAGDQQANIQAALDTLFGSY